MPTPVPAGLRLGLVEPADAVAAFEQRSLLQPSYAWQDVWQEEHARAFAVAGVQRLDVLQIFQDELAAGIKAGTSLAEFRKAITPRLTAKGFWGDVEVKDAATGETRITRFDNRRLQLIYDVNMRQSFAAGRWARIERNKGRLPFVMYRTMRDELVRAAHRPWDGVVLPVDHPWWETHYPPCGWRCRCTAFALAQKDIDRRLADGERLTQQAPEEQFITYVNPRSGEVAPIPRGIDPGFAYNPGKGRDAAGHEAALRKALAASPLAGAVAVAQAEAAFPAFVAGSTVRFGALVNRALRGDAASGEMRMLGALLPGPVRAAQGQGLALQTAVVGMRDAEIAQTLAAATDVALAANLLRQLPDLLGRTKAVVLDQAADELVVVSELAASDGRRQRVAVRIRLAAVNLIQSAAVVSDTELADRARYRLLWGRL